MQQFSIFCSADFNMAVCIFQFHALYFIAFGIIIGGILFYNTQAMYANMNIQASFMPVNVDSRHVGVELELPDN